MLEIYQDVFERPRVVCIRTALIADFDMFGDVGDICVFHIDAIPEGWTPCDGTFLPCMMYLRLFNLIGLRYCPPMIERRSSYSLFAVLFCGKPYRVRLPNPSYRPGYFRLPNLAHLAPKGVGPILDIRV